MTETTSAATPAATRDLDRVMADLDRLGVCIVEGALEGEKLTEVRTALNRAAVSARPYGLMQDYSGVGPTRGRWCGGNA